MTTFPISSTPARAFRPIVVALALMLVVAAFAATPAHAAGTVTNCSTYGPGAGTLQSALSGGGTITFACSGTIVVPEIFITSNTMIDATGQNVTLSGNNANRVFTVSNNANLTLHSITVANGRSLEDGGGAYVDSGSTLTVENSTFTGNSTTDPNARGGAIRNDGTLSITNSAITSNSSAYIGGGIYSQGTLTITDSAITGNSSQSDGGGMYINNPGSTTIQSSTISGNSGDNGGGILMASSGALTVNNSTISGNTARESGGGIGSRSGTTTLINSTVTANQGRVGGGLFHQSSGGLSVSNTIVAGNTASDSAPDLGGTITSNDYNLVGDTSGVAIFTPQAHDITGVNPLLGTLADNGGPTLTHALLPGSPAIDAGDTTLTTDQRGVARPQAAADDIGAVEASCAAFPVSAANEGELNFAIACFNAETTPGTYTINVTQGISLTASTVTINNATSGIDLVINGGGFAVDGQGTSGVSVFNIAVSTTVTMNEITVTGGNTSSGQDGGGIENRGNLTLNDSTFVNNKSGRDGSAISNFGILTVTGSTFSGNQAGAAGAGSGGALRNHSTGQLTVSNSTFTGNFGGNHEVDLYNNGTAILDSVTMARFYGFFTHSATFRNSILLECGLLGNDPVDGGHNLVQNPGNCGGFTAPTTLVGVAPLLGPLADNGGPTQTRALLPGSPAINAGDTTLTTDQRGVARPQGPADDIGAVEARCAAFPVSVANEGELNFAIACYNAETAPGTYTINLTQDIDLTASTTAIDNATNGVALVIEGNGHAVDGQGTSGVRPFTINDDTTVTLKTMTITGGNVTDFGGGISSSGTLSVLNSTISYNQATNSGGGIDNSGTLYLVNSTVSNNVASNQTDRGLGGGIFNGGTLLVTNSTVSDNQSYLTGGGIQNGAFGSTLTLHNSIVANNTASSSADCFNLLGTATAQNSLVETGTPGSGCLNGPNNLNGDPNLGPLQNNGGPTETHALLNGSIAINAGANALAVDPDGNPLTTDQRGAGFPRVLAGTVDMGAYETGAPVPQEGTLTIVKNASPADGTAFPFTVDPGPYDYSLQWSLPGAVGGVATDAAGNVYVTTVDSVRKYDAAGILLTQFGSNGSAEGEFNLISNVTFDAAGNIYVVDSGNFRVQVFDAAGTFLRMWGWGVQDGSAALQTCTSGCQAGIPAGIPGGDGQFLAAAGITVGPTGTVYVTDVALVRVQAFDSSGNFLFQLDGGSADNQIAGTPTTIASDSAGNIYVIQSDGGQRVQVFDAAGNFLRMWGWGVQDGSAALQVCTSGCQAGVAGSGDGQLSDAVGIAVDGAGNVYVADSANHRVQKYSNGGAFLSTWGWGVLDGSSVLQNCTSGCQAGVAGSGDGQLDIPTSLTVNANGQVYVADGAVGNERVQSFTPSQSASLQNGQSDSFTLPAGVYRVSELVPADWTLDTVSCDGGSPTYAGSTAEVSLAGGDDITCTFTNSYQPLGITLASFEAAAQADHVLVTWETVSELENSGFNLYRTDTADPPAAANLLGWIPSQGPGSAQGFFYSYPDYDVTAGQTYWYWLEDVDFSGITTMHGPISVVFLGPTAVTLSGLEAAGQPQPMPVWPLALAAIAAALAVAGGLQLRRRDA